MIPEQRILNLINVISAISVIISGAIGCVTPKGSAPFREFPKNFYAVQILNVEASEHSHQLLAQLQRQGDQYDVLFLEPALQIPLLRLAKAADGTQDIETLRDGLKLPFDPSVILHSIATLHSAKRFQAIDGSDGMFYTLEDNDVSYRLSEIIGDETCLYPRKIDLVFRKADGSIAATLKIINEDFKCDA